jgi:hypothetical protein
MLFSSGGDLSAGMRTINGAVREAQPFSGSLVPSARLVDGALDFADDALDAAPLRESIVEAGREGAKLLGGRAVLRALEVAIRDE